MKISLLIIVLLVVGAVFSQASAGAATIRDEIQALLNQAAAAFNKKDLEGVIQTAVPEATMLRLDGTSLTISQWKELAKKDIAEMDTLRVEFKVESAEAEGQTAKATYTEIDVYTLLKDKNHQYNEVSRWTVSLVKTPQGWRCKHFEQLSREGTRDGQPHKTLTSPKN